MRALRLSPNGPEFPGEFVDSLLAGEMVFLCGTGVSAPQMPNFRRLVLRTYETLGVMKDDSEKRAFKKEHFEEVLGSLNRRLSDSQAMIRAVAGLLVAPQNPDLRQHHTILRLSRGLDNQVCVVTTNFDTLFERAFAETVPAGVPIDISFAGQALPTPGNPSFSGIIHIHGRLKDVDLELASTPLVLTSADYGDAYMRSGWASRFLFDLARCKSIVLVGYSANDAPVRYFLNVLESDRARFPDLKPVYAFDAYEQNPEEAIARWGTLAVRVLPYCKVNPNTGSRDDHFALWDDLAALADIADRPKRSQQERARTILGRSATDVSTDIRKKLGWLFGGRSDLWSIARDAISDSSWFAVFQDDNLWSVEDAAWVIAAWIAKDFQDRGRLECALEWQRRLGRPFTENIERRLAMTEGLDETWARVWRLFCLVEPIESDTSVHATQKRLVSGVVLNGDVRKAVSLLAPRLELNRRLGEAPADVGSQPITRFVDIAWPHMVVADEDGVEALIDTLCTLPGPRRTDSRPRNRRAAIFP